MSEYSEITNEENINQLFESEKQYFIDLFKIDEEVKKLTLEKIKSVKKFKDLEVEIKLKESEYIMTPGFSELKNDTLRNAARRLASADLRKELSKAEVSISEGALRLKLLDQERETLLNCIQGVKTRMNLIASLFNYMGGKYNIPYVVYPNGTTPNPDTGVLKVTCDGTE